MRNDKQNPGISFKKVFLSTLSFERKPFLSETKQIEVDFSVDRNISKDGKSLALVLKCFINEKKGAFNIKCSIVGLFEKEDSTSKMSLESFAESNAPALLFPYLREVISTTTLKAKIGPIVLPPVNIRNILNTK